MQCMVETFIFPVSATRSTLHFAFISLNEHNAEQSTYVMVNGTVYVCHGKVPVVVMGC